MHQTLVTCTTVARRSAAVFLTAAALGIPVAASADAGRGAMTPRVDGTAAQPILMAQAAAARPAAADLDALIKAAKAEGDFVYYIDLTENVAKAVSDAFAAKYGIKAQFIRLAGGAAVQQRYAAEAESGNVASDLIIMSGAVVEYAEQGIQKGWVESISTAALPVLRSGEFPAKLNRGPTAIVQVTPWVIVYNTDKVSGADVPKDWADVLLPKWKDQLLVVSPRAGDTFQNLYGFIHERHGDAFFSRLRAQGARILPNGSLAIQALAAGEGAIMLSTIAPLVTTLRQKGAPVNSATPEYNTGNEMHVMLTARAKSKRPNAARLFANYVMSPDGNRVFNDEPGVASVYDAAGLPRLYEAPRSASVARRGQLMQALGVQ